MRRLPTNRELAWMGLAYRAALAFIAVCAAGLAVAVAVGERWAAPAFVVAVCVVASVVALVRRRRGA